MTDLGSIFVKNMEEKFEFELSLQELEYLKQFNLPSGLSAAIINYKNEYERKISVRLSSTEAEQLRDYLTLKLAENGFDKNYAVNEQGQILEELIDRFFLK